MEKLRAASGQTLDHIDGQTAHLRVLLCGSRVVIAIDQRRLKPDNIGFPQKSDDALRTVR